MVDWKGFLQRLRKDFSSLSSDAKKIIIGLLAFVSGLLPIWSMLSFGSYIQAVLIVGGIFLLFSDKAFEYISGSGSTKKSDDFCSKCGSVLFEGEDFCSKCGRKRREAK